MSERAFFFSSSVTLDVAMTILNKIIVMDEFSSVSDSLIVVRKLWNWRGIIIRSFYLCEKQIWILTSATISYAVSHSLLLSQGISVDFSPIDSKTNWLKIIMV